MMSKGEGKEVLSGRVIFSKPRWYKFVLVPKITIKLIGSNNDEHSGFKKLMREGKDSSFENETGEIAFTVSFDCDTEMGRPGAILVRNDHRSSKFFIKSLNLESQRIHFNCNSWIFPTKCTGKNRIFFANKAYLPHETPVSLHELRKEELQRLRGDGRSERKRWENIYDYDVYNDIWTTECNPNHKRPILGGNEHPYPRRGRTGRPLSRKNNKYETRCPTKDIYVPSDERFSDLKKSEFNGSKFKATTQALKDIFKSSIGMAPKHFESFKEVTALYKPGLFNKPAKLSNPHVIKDDEEKWKTDEEFTRQMLAGVNPIVIRRLQEFPPLSKLNPESYGVQTSQITEECIKNSLGNLSVDEALAQNKLYILDHHDLVIPLLEKINTETATKAYATRTFLFLNNDGTLKPIAIELSLPHPQGNQYGIDSRIILPHLQKPGELLWQLAKAYVLVNDSGHHQLCSHWLNTHAIIEPFVIATHRQLSVLHPIHKLLIPHFRYTLKINSLARSNLINADGIIEKTQYPSKFSMEMSSMAYQSWNFNHQALPTDLINRGIAIEDSRFPHGLRLLIVDYPYAVDGLEIWAAIQTWVKEYCSFYYKDNEMVRKDTELESWWKEVREKGHEDKKDEQWWPKMQTIEELIDSCTIIIWISSALHAAVNFGQYSYGGFLPNRPTMSKMFLPEPGTADHDELRSNFEKIFMKIFTSEPQNDLMNLFTIEFLSTQSVDEVYLGQRSNLEQTFDGEVLEAFKRLKKELDQIEVNIKKRNENHNLKNRVGAVKIPYTLLHPTSTAGITCKGIPNSISI